MGKGILIIAGPNGAGKTTFAESFLPQEGGCLTFLNADIIAKGFSPFAPELAAIRAGKFMSSEMDKMVDQAQSFSFETTLSGMAYAGKIARWRSLGYTVTLLFLSLPDAETAIKRVRYRVSQGGHDIPEVDIRRRYERGLRNFQTRYKFIVDHWLLYDASESSPSLLEEGP